MPELTRVVCCQLAPSVGELAQNRALAVDAVHAAVSDGADVVVLPELITSGYCFSSADELASVAIGLDHPVFDEWAAAAKSAVVIGGLAELGEDGLVYNSAALVTADGLQAVYRKIHLWDAEKLYFTPGTVAPPVVKTRIGQIGLLVCYDLEFPELTRSLALREADLIAVPTNWPRVDRPVGQRAPEVIIAMAAARVNRVPIACCDRTGIERGQAWNEGTAIIDEAGWPVGDELAGVGFVRADLDLALGRDKNISTRNNVFTDRRPSMYDW